jgi:hypothetical protein
VNRAADGALRPAGRTVAAGFKSGEHAQLLEDPKTKKAWACCSPSHKAPGRLLGDR